MKKDFSCYEGESLTTCLIRCSDKGTDSLHLDGREAMSLRSLARAGGFDKATGKKNETRSLWRWLLSAVKSKYHFKSDTVCCSGKWTTMKKGIKHLRELAVQLPRPCLDSFRTSL